MNHATLHAEHLHLAPARGIDRWVLSRTLGVLLIAFIVWARLIGHALIFWGLGQFASIFIDRYSRR